MSSISCEPNAYYSFRELYRIHLTESFFVVRAKTHLKYKIVKWQRRMPNNVLTDAEVKLTGYLSEKKYPESFRLIRYYDEEDDREFTFLTNAKQLSALDVANLYQKRWLVELFFYDKFIVMRSHSKCISDYQNVTYLLLISALHNNMIAMTSFHLNVRTNGYQKDFL